MCQQSTPLMFSSTLRSSALLGFSSLSIFNQYEPDFGLIPNQIHVEISGMLV